MDRFRDSFLRRGVCSRYEDLQKELDNRALALPKVAAIGPFIIIPISVPKLILKEEN